MREKEILDNEIESKRKTQKTTLWNSSCIGEENKRRLFLSTYVHLCTSNSVALSINYGLVEDCYLRI